MILCVCLSPALDVTYRVDTLEPGTAHRVTAATTRAGGKAVNVARVLHLLGEDVHLVAPVGSATGAELAAALDDAGITATLVPDDAATRRTVTVVAADGTATMLSESARVTSWPALHDHVAGLVAAADVLVVSGSQPDGVPDGGVATLVGLAHDRGVPSVVDTSGAALRAALAAGPTLVKPNAEELADLLGPELDEDLPSAVAGLAGRHRVGVVASRGPAGVVAAIGDEGWVVSPGAVLTGNPTGAGDALVAGLARHLERGSGDWATGLADAVAVSMAAVESAVAGDLDPARVPGHAAGVGVRGTVPR